MSVDRPLVGIVNERVAIARFRPAERLIGYGELSFSGYVPDPLIDVKNGFLGLGGWGCGLMAMTIHLQLKGVHEATLERAVKVGRQHGSNESEGTGEGELQEVAKFFDIHSELVSIGTDPAAIYGFLKAGCGVVLNGWESTVDEAADSFQTGDGHWRSVAGASPRGDVLFADSTFRGVGGTGKELYGPWWTTAAGLLIMAQDCAGGRFNESGTVVLEGADWAHMFAIVTSPIGAAPDYVKTTVDKIKGATIYRAENK